MEQWTGSKLEKEYIKAVYCHPVSFSIPAPPQTDSPKPARFIAFMAFNSFFLTSQVSHLLTTALPLRSLSKPSSRSLSRFFFSSLYRFQGSSLSLSLTA